MDLQSLLTLLIVVAALAYLGALWRPRRSSADATPGCNTCSGCPVAQGCGSKAEPPATATETIQPAAAPPKAYPSHRAPSTRRTRP